MVRVPSLKNLVGKTIRLNDYLVEDGEENGRIAMYHPVMKLLGFTEDDRCIGVRETYISRNGTLDLREEDWDVTDFCEGPLSRGYDIFENEKEVRAALAEQRKLAKATVGMKYHDAISGKKKVKVA